MSPTMTEGGIASWKKAEGEAFAAGDVLLEIVRLLLLYSATQTAHVSCLRSCYRRRTKLPLTSKLKMMVFLARFSYDHSFSETAQVIKLLDRHQTVLVACKLAKLLLYLLKKVMTSQISRSQQTMHQLTSRRLLQYPNQVPRLPHLPPPSHSPLQNHGLMSLPHHPVPSSPLCFVS